MVPLAGQALANPVEVVQQIETSTRPHCDVTDVPTALKCLVEQSARHGLGQDAV